MVGVDLIDGYLGAPLPTGKDLEWQINARAFPGNEIMTRHGSNSFDHIFKRRQYKPLIHQFK